MRPPSLDLQPVLTVDVERVRKARALELLITGAMCLAGILGCCIVQARVSETEIQILLEGTLDKDAVGWGPKDVKVSGIIPLRSDRT